MRFKHFSILLFTLFLLSCSGNNSDKVMLDDPTELYSSGIKYLSEKKFSKALAKFSAIEKEHPAYKLASNATMLKMYAYFRSEKFDDALFAAEDFIRNYPGNKNIDYVYYIKAISLLNQILDFERDQQLTEDSLFALNELITRFPDSKYADSAREKQQFVYNTIAAKEMAIGRFYLSKNDVIAAAPRFQNVIRSYPSTLFKKEALYRMIEVCVTLGLHDDAKRYSEALHKEFPDDKWTRRSRALIRP